MCETTTECPDSRYAFAPALAAIHVTSDHFHIDPLADLYTEHVRIASHVKGCISPLRVWQKYQANEFPQEELLDLALELFKTGSRRHVPVKDCASFYLREALFLKSRECTQFKATLSKAILQFCALRLNQHLRTIQVLDPCTGWGDRLAGALSVGVDTYTGVDPNPLLQSGHEAMSRELAQLTKCTFHQVPFEDAELRGPFDIIFTSPPFSSFELYYTGTRQDPNQSSGRHSDQRWAKNWLLPAASKMVSLLRPGGLLALYLSDTKVGLHCELLLEHMREEPVEFLGVVWCCRHDRRRPLWIWQCRESVPLALGNDQDDQDV
jgi:hypothetical protein